jgi:hypothetical protein
VNAERITLLVFVALFVLTLVGRLLPPGRRRPDRRDRATRSGPREEQRVVRGLARLPTEAKVRVREALDAMLADEERRTE